MKTCGNQSIKIKIFLSLSRQRRSSAKTASISPKRPSDNCRMTISRQMDTSNSTRRRSTEFYTKSPFASFRHAPTKFHLFLFLQFRKDGNLSHTLHICTYHFIIPHISSWKLHIPVFLKLPTVKD